MKTLKVPTMIGSSLSEAEVEIVIDSPGNLAVTLATDGYEHDFVITHKPSGRAVPGSNHPDAEALELLMMAFQDIPWPADFESVVSDPAIEKHWVECLHSWGRLFGGAA